MAAAISSPPAGSIRQGPATLLSLPLEIRQQIYNLLLGPLFRSVEVEINEGGNTTTSYECQPRHPLNLLRVCKQIRNEANPIAQRSFIHLVSTKVGSDYFQTYAPMHMIKDASTVTVPDSLCNLPAVLERYPLALFWSLRTIEFRNAASYRCNQFQIVKKQNNVSKPVTLEDLRLMDPVKISLDLAAMLEEDFDLTEVQEYLGDNNLAVVAECCLTTGEAVPVAEATLKWTGAGLEVLSIEEPSARIRNEIMLRDQKYQELKKTLLKGG